MSALRSQFAIIMKTKLAATHYPLTHSHTHTHAENTHHSFLWLNDIRLLFHLSVWWTPAWRESSRADKCGRHMWRSQLKHWCSETLTCCMCYSRSCYFAGHNWVTCVSVVYLYKVLGLTLSEISSLCSVLRFVMGALFGPKHSYWMIWCL